MNSDYKTIKCPHCDKNIELELEAEFLEIDASVVTPTKKINGCISNTDEDVCPDCKLFKINCICSRFLEVVSR